MSVGALLAAVLATQVGPDTAAACDGFGGPMSPSRDIYCVELVRNPTVPAGEGILELMMSGSPVGTRVRRDGRLAFGARLTLSDLPDPSTLGDYTTYVAWVGPPVMFPMRKLGEVGNGTTTLPDIDLNKFMVLISAERSADAAERKGRIVLRAMSPATRMRPADLMEYMVAGPGLDQDSPRADGDLWPRPPLPAQISMLLSLMELEPNAMPYLPSTTAPSGLPRARPREVVDLSDGDTLRLTAGMVRKELHGRSFVMFAFNEQIPGPLLRVPQNATITVLFENRIDWPLTVHWHGVRIENRYDGTPVTQDVVPPGGGFEYSVFFRDAGIYWYHPHVREDVTQDLGLYGNMRVLAEREDFYGPAHREEILTLDDILVGEDDLMPYGTAVATHALMGRFGNVFLVNGEPEWTAEATRGEVIRFFFTNVSNTRTYNLSFGGAPMKLVGSDVGNFEREEWVESVVIAPAERYVVHVRFPEAGSYPLVNDVQGIDHLYGTYFPESDTLGVVEVSAAAVGEDLSGSFEVLREDRATVEEIERYRPHFDRPVDHELELTMEAPGLPRLVRRLMQLDSAYFSPVEWSGTMPMMNWAATASDVRWILRDPRTGDENMDIAWSFSVGDVVKLRLHNQRRVLHAMQHPIHLHGQRFLLLEMNGVPNRNRVWKDTLMLPVGATADILLELSNPGLWMLHCHIAEHLEAGMMMVFSVQ
ncbi:MAG: hypothetical protein BMS9Abin29_0809 [Gemmatimonadota bacterium]|nr:MAG: hypothetical protein BMS9Abin29_0809 [Gemmatimonadota bacterium]